MMGGWKTWCAAIGFVLLGIVDLVNGDNESGMQRLATAIGFIGLGHKIEKAGK
jgi:hypothetical protein